MTSPAPRLQIVTIEQMLNGMKPSVTLIGTGRRLSVQ